MTEREVVLIYYDQMLEDVNDVKRATYFITDKQFFSYFVIK